MTCFNISIVLNKTKEVLRFCRHVFQPFIKHRSRHVPLCSPEILNCKHRSQTCNEYNTAYKYFRKYLKGEVPQNYEYHFFKVLFPTLKHNWIFKWKYSGKEKCSWRGSHRTHQKIKMYTEKPSFILNWKYHENHISNIFANLLTQKYQWSNLILVLLTPGFGVQQN